MTLQKYQIKTIGDLRKVEDKLKPGFTLNLMIDQMDTKLLKTYHLNLSNVKTMEPKLRYTAVKREILIS